jgi:hypothetical protein
MMVLKYFHEEPASLEALSADHDPDARGRRRERSLADFLSKPRVYRGYLTATDLGAGRFALTALPELPFDRLLEYIVSGRSAHAWTADGNERPFSADAIRARPAEFVAVVIGARIERDAAVSIAGSDRRRTLGALRPLLVEGRIVMLREPAHDGVDLSLFSAESMKPAVQDAMRRIAGSDLRAFSIPYHEARSEEKFYFERYDFERFRTYELTKPER